MDDNNKEIHIEDDDARAGATPGVMRYVLGFSLLLAIIAMTLVWIIPSLYEGDVEGARTATERVEEMQDDGLQTEKIPAVPTEMQDDDGEPAPDE